MASKGLKVKTKVMKTSSSGRVITESGVYPCRVCGKEVADYSLTCNQCKKWVQGSPKKASPTYVCRRCRNPIPKEKLLEIVTVDGDVFEGVHKFCYLGNSMDSDRGVEEAVRARIRIGWKKFK